MPDAGSSMLRVPAELELYGDRMARVAHVIEDSLNTLQSQLAPVADLWMSSASSEYFSVQGEWNRIAGDFLTAEGTLGHIANRANINWNNYVEAEDLNRRNMRGF